MLGTKPSGKSYFTVNTNTSPTISQYEASLYINEETLNNEEVLNEFLGLGLRALGGVAVKHGPRILPGITKSFGKFIPFALKQIPKLGLGVVTCQFFAEIKDGLIGLAKRLGNKMVTLEDFIALGLGLGVAYALYKLWQKFNADPDEEDISAEEAKVVNEEIIAWMKTMENTK